MRTFNFLIHTSLAGLILLLSGLAFADEYSQNHFTSLDDVIISQPTSTDHNSLEYLEFTTSKGIANLHQVTDGIFRGGRPGYDGFFDLMDMNINTIINIENNSSAIRREKERAEELGIELVISKMSWLRPPTDKQVDDILLVMQDPNNYPIFLHCQHGRDRTGMMVGLYRVEVEGWSPKRAYEEMLQLGFRPWLRALDNYFRERTQYWE